jgi:serine/threonine-protein kinase
MSPEQCRCEPLDRRSDVFCAGIVLYELTTGLRPFGAANEYLVTKAILEDDPVWPSARDAAYPAELEAIVRRALAKDRRERQPSAHALHEELATLASKHRLDVSQFALQRAMASLFDAELGAWKAAQDSERSLVELAVARTRSDAAPPRPVAVAGATEPEVTAPTRAERRATRARWPRIAAIGGIVAAFAAGAWLFRNTNAQSEPTQPAAAAVPAPVAAPIDAGVAAAAPPDAAPAPVVHRHPPPAVHRPTAKKPNIDELIR